MEYYFGYSYENSDLTCENFRSRAIMWAQSRHAVDFFANNRVPFQDMSNENNRLLSVNAITQDDDTTNESNWCLVGPIAIVVYLPSGGSDEINLAGWEAVSKNSTSLEVEAVVSIRWFDPRNGGLLQTGSIPAVQIPVSPQTLSPVVVSLGDAPYQPNQDWAVLLLRCTVGC